VAYVKGYVETHRSIMMCANNIYIYVIYYNDMELRPGIYIYCLEHYCAFKAATTIILAICIHIKIHIIIRDYFASIFAFTNIILIRKHSKIVIFGKIFDKNF
jgi:hypothetical protein